MRHGHRLDTASDFSTITDELWPDRHTRPYDTPLADTSEELVVGVAADLQAHGLSTFDAIVCSPFRRCVQTAALVCRALGIKGARIVIDNRLGEYMPAANRSWKTAGIDPPGEYSYASADDVAHWAGVSPADLLWDRDANPMLDEADENLYERVQSIPVICAEALKRVGVSGTSASPPAVLVVTHGDLINRFVPSFEFDDSIGRYSASECGWLACTGFEPLVDYEGDTIDLGLVPRVHASAGLEPL